MRARGQEDSWRRATQSTGFRGDPAVEHVMQPIVERTDGDRKLVGDVIHAKVPSERGQNVAVGFCNAQ